jgi:hypothetical protein
LDRDQSARGQMVAFCHHNFFLYFHGFIAMTDQAASHWLGIIAA